MYPGAQLNAGNTKPKISYYKQTYDRWRSRLRGTKVVCGQFDIEIELAYRFHWTLDQVWSLDPLYVEELRARINAEADHDALQRKKDARKA